MTRRLPPLNQLRAFEAAARRQSFKDAADELNVTSAAVSHQIKALEADLGVTLFRRVTRGVRLTPEAEALARDLTDSFARIAEAVSQVREAHTSGPLRVTSAPFFGNHVLLPRLAEFHAAHPGIEVQLSLDYGYTDFRTSDAHLGLRYGTGGWSELTAVPLANDVVSPVAAPSLLGGRAMPLDPAEIARLPLAADRIADGGDWPAWFAAAGLPRPDRPMYVHFDNRALALDFALAGNGVSLADLRIVHHELKTGQLLRLHPVTLDWDRGMFVVYRQTDNPDPKILAFTEWIAATIAAIDITAGAPG